MSSMKAKKLKGSFDDAILPPAIVRTSHQEFKKSSKHASKADFTDLLVTSPSSVKNSEQDVSAQEKLDRAESVLGRLFSSIGKGEPEFQKLSPNHEQKSGDVNIEKKQRPRKLKYLTEEQESDEESIKPKWTGKQTLHETKHKKSGKHGSKRKLDIESEDSEEPSTKKSKSGRKPRKSTAYNIWSKGIRSKILQGNPDLDFSSVSRIVGDMWSQLSQSEKMFWERKARKTNSSGSMLISTGKRATMVKTGSSAQVLPGRPPKPKTSPVITEPVFDDEESMHSTTKVARSPGRARGPPRATPVAPIDLAAYFRLTGEAMVTIGERLQELCKKSVHVQGTTSVLMDGFICALAPLACLADSLPALRHPLTDTEKCQLLDNVGYILPGIS